MVARSAGGRGHGSQLRAPRAEPKLLPASPVGRATARWSRKKRAVGGREEKNGRGVRSEERRGPEGDLGAFI
jgi:hypothetical protein